MTSPCPELVDAMGDAPVFLVEDDGVALAAWTLTPRSDGAWLLTQDETPMAS